MRVHDTIVAIECRLMKGLFLAGSQFLIEHRSRFLLVLLFCQGITTRK